jgi:hypothetical protein
VYFILSEPVTNKKKVLLKLVTFTFIGISTRLKMPKANFFLLFVSLFLFLYLQNINAKKARFTYIDIYKNVTSNQEKANYISNDSYGRPSIIV